MSDNPLKNQHKAHLDQGQIYNAIFDGNNESLRVSVVDGLELKVENLSIPEFKMPDMIPVIVKETSEVRVPEIIRELQIEKVEVPLVIREVQIVEIEKPVHITEVKVIEIEKPIVIKEIEYKVIEQKIYEIPMIVKVCMIVQAVALLGMLLTKAL